MAEIDYDYYAVTGKIRPRERGSKAKKGLKKFGKGAVASVKAANRMKKSYEKEHGSLWNVAGEGWMWSKPKKRHKKSKKYSKSKMTISFG